MHEVCSNIRIITIACRSSKKKQEVNDVIVFKSYDSRMIFLTNQKCTHKFTSW